VLAAHHDNATVRDRVLLDDLIRGPADIVKPGHHVVTAGFCFERAESRHAR
jgi:hypothetical protein